MTKPQAGRTRAPRPRQSSRRRLSLVAAALAVVVLAAACEAAPGDFTGDRKADLVTFDSTGAWYQQGQATPIWNGPALTDATTFVVPGDYNGDAKWEPAELAGTTWTSSALADPISYDPTGMPAGPPATPGPIPGTFELGAPPTLLPVPGDYDGDGKTVPAYYDQVDASWWIMGHAGSVRFGTPPAAGGSWGYSVPVPADYDGDGKTDIAVYDPPTATFHYLSSKTGLEVSLQEGQPGDFPVPADYDHVGHAEAAVTDWAFQTWCVAGHAGSVATFPLGNDYYVPVQADYDGDGKADPAVYDVPAGKWLVAGQPAVSEPSSTLRPADIPAALLVNIVRLTYFTEGLAALGTPRSCAGP
jgi:hypothetical protein